MTAGARGSGLVGVLVLVALLSVGVLAAAPLVAHADRAAPAARHLAVTLQALRFRAVSLNRGAGLLFERDGAGWRWWQVEDGNGNGLRTAEVRRGIDPTVDGPFRLEWLVEHATLGFPPAAAIPRIPPATGNIRDRTDPIRFGRSDLIGFAPLGTSSSGTIYVTDGRHRLYGVVLYGRTARLRVWRYDTREGRWRL